LFTVTQHSKEAMSRFRLKNFAFCVARSGKTPVYVLLKGNGL